MYSPEGTSQLILVQNGRKGGNGSLLVIEKGFNYSNNGSGEESQSIGILPPMSHSSSPLDRSLSPLKVQ